MLLNIELKGPLSDDWVSQYDYDLAAQKVIELIDRYDIGKKTMISSFVTRIIDSVTRVSSSPPAEHPRTFIIQSLRNRGIKADPDNYRIFDQTTGINIYIDYLEGDLVNQVRA